MIYVFGGRGGLAGQGTLMYYQLDIKEINDDDETNH